MEGFVIRMLHEIGGSARLRFSPGRGIPKAIVCLLVLAAVVFSTRSAKGQDEQLPLDDITAKYHFLSSDDTLAILDEEGRLKGYIEVTQPADESDDILTFNIMEGSRKKNHVEFRTNKIHGKYYRFSGIAEHGKGHDDKDSDYLQLSGSVDIVTVNSETGKESVQVMRLTLKSIGKGERPDE